MRDRRQRKCSPSLSLSLSPPLPLTPRPFFLFLSRRTHCRRGTLEQSCTAAHTTTTRMRRHRACATGTKQQSLDADQEAPPVQGVAREKGKSSKNTERGRKGEAGGGCGGAGTGGDGPTLPVCRASAENLQATDSVRALSVFTASIPFSPPAAGTGDN